MRAFEAIVEPLGLTALAIQVLTGLWMVVPELWQVMQTLRLRAITSTSLSR